MGKIDPKMAALVNIEPQNDFPSEKGVVRDLVADLAVENQVMDKLKALITKAKEAEVAVVYSPHY